VTQITAKSGRGVPRSSDVIEAELAVDLDSGHLYTKLGDGKVTALNTAEFIGVDTNADNYQYWRYKVDGAGTVNVFSMQDLNFQSGSGVSIESSGYGVKFSAATLVISDTEPTEKMNGMQWLDVTMGKVFIWDEDKWLEFPTT
jgi:hypothetical protein